MAKKGLTDEQVEAEIERLKQSSAYKLARAEQAYKNKRRQTMYSMRWLEKHGKKLMEAGYTQEDFIDPE